MSLRLSQSPLEVKGTVLFQDKNVLGLVLKVYRKNMRVSEDTYLLASSSSRTFWAVCSLYCFLWIMYTHFFSNPGADISLSWPANYPIWWVLREKSTKIKAETEEREIPGCYTHLSEFTIPVFLATKPYYLYAWFCSFTGKGIHIENVLGFLKEKIVQFIFMTS